ncbi:hypothetical protein BMS3Abin15_00408 [bacterium BMS3Abin15]|nr:hypothetical protein BMS3Abin15_00408 [bacterium BMS3Abin15]
MPGKVKYHELSSGEKKKYLGEFYSMVSLLKNRDEVKFFSGTYSLSVKSQCFPGESRWPKCF